MRALLLQEADPLVIVVVPIADADPATVEALVDAAFGADRRGRTAYRLREGLAAMPALSFAAFDGDALVGSLQSWPVELVAASGERAPLVLVGPVAVAPERQRVGIGKLLMERALAAADAANERALLLIGDPEYYDRFFGFSAAATVGWEVPGPVERHRLLARLSEPDALPAKGMLGPRREAPASSRAA